MTEQDSKQLLLKALNTLDGRLASAGCDPVEIRIVGGFALILNDIKTENCSCGRFVSDTR